MTKEASIKKTFEYVRNIPVNFQNFIANLDKSENSLIERFYILLPTTKIRAELRDYHRLCRFDSDKLDLLYKRCQMPKPTTAEDEIINAFHLHMSEQNSDEVQTYDCQINIYFQEKADYKMYFTFEIDYNKKL